MGALAGAAIGGGVGAVTGATTSPQDVNLGTPPWSNPEVRTPIDDNHRSATRSHSRTHAHTASSTRSTATDARDRAYMGGGMVGTDQTSGTTGTAAPMSGTGTGTTTR